MIPEDVQTLADTSLFSCRHQPPGSNQLTQAFVAGQLHAEARRQGKYLDRLLFSMHVLKLAGASAPGSTLLTQAFVAGYSMQEQDSKANT